MSWATNHDASLEGLGRVQGSLTVDLIMVRRDKFDTCSVDETAAEIKRRNGRQYSYFPVANADGQIIGLYDAERWFRADAPEVRIGDDFERFSEEIVIGSNASIVDFIRQADSYPTNLVISGNSIAGLVSLSDIQQLPARAAIFAVITSLEMAMTLAIERRWPKPIDWIKLLSRGRREKLQNEIAGARRKDGFVNEIAFTQISDKAGLICKGKLLGRSTSSIMKEFKAIRKLRDDLVHANSYADSPEAAKEVCAIVRSIYQLKDDLLQFIERSLSKN